MTHAARSRSPSTLLKLSPLSVQQMSGNLNDTERVLMTLAGE